MSEARIRRMTPDEFFVWQAEQDRNYELVDGVPVMTPKALTGATRRHDKVTADILSLLIRQLDGKPCQLYTDDISVRNPNGNVRRPDILVDCGPDDDRSAERADPRLLIEVLSPSTTRFDRFQKLEEYKAHPAVRVVLLEDTDAPRVIVWRRDAADAWSSAITQGLDQSIPLPEVEAALRLADIDRRVRFAESG